jgi:ABC-type Mn2+/Zn2+ transport system ATPase subunit
VGKTTFLKTICGFENFSGTIKINPSVKIGYFAQELDNLNNEASVLDGVLSTGTTSYMVLGMLVGTAIGGAITVPLFAITGNRYLLLFLA